MYLRQKPTIWQHNYLQILIKSFINCPAEDKAESLIKCFKRQDYCRQGIKAAGYLIKLQCTKPLGAGLGTIISNGCSKRGH